MAAIQRKKVGNTANPYCMFTHEFMQEYRRKNGIPYPNGFKAAMNDPELKERWDKLPKEQKDQYRDRAKMEKTRLRDEYAASVIRLLPSTNRRNDDDDDEHDFYNDPNDTMPWLEENAQGNAVLVRQLPENQSSNLSTRQSQPAMNTSAPLREIQPNNNLLPQARTNNDGDGGGGDVRSDMWAVTGYGCPPPAARRFMAQPDSTFGRGFLSRDDPPQATATAARTVHEFNYEDTGLEVYNGEYACDLMGNTNESSERDEQQQGEDEVIDEEDDVVLLRTNAESVAPTPLESIIENELDSSEQVSEEKTEDSDIVQQDQSEQTDKLPPPTEVAQEQRQQPVQVEVVPIAQAQVSPPPETPIAVQPFVATKSQLPPSSGPIQSYSAPKTTPIRGAAAPTPTLAPIPNLPPINATGASADVSPSQLNEEATALRFGWSHEFSEAYMAQNKMPHGARGIGRGLQHMHYFMRAENKVRTFLEK